jgi:hypothetical protein
MNLVLIPADDAPIDAVGAALDHAGLGRVERWSVPSELDELARARIDPRPGPRLSASSNPWLSAPSLQL